VNAFVAVTDGEWFRFLAGQPGLDEVNFWQPSPRTFRTLQPGEPFLFKLHAPESFIAGGGFFVRWSPLPCSMAWEVFGLENGAATLGDMRRRVERYRRVPASSEDYEVGCIVLTQPFFFERADWFSPPEDFSPNVQTGKRSDLSEPPHGTRLWEEVALRTMARELDLDIEVEAEPGRTFGEPILVRPRLGQGAFRVLVTETYERRCAITGEKILPVLEAAHPARRRRGAAPRRQRAPVPLGRAHAVRPGLCDRHARSPIPRQPSPARRLPQRRVLPLVRRARDLGASSPGRPAGSRGARVALGHRVPRVSRPRPHGVAGYDTAPILI